MRSIRKNYIVKKFKDTVMNNKETDTKTQIIANVAMKMIL